MNTRKSNVVFINTNDSRWSAKVFAEKLIGEPYNRVVEIAANRAMEQDITIASFQKYISDFLYGWWGMKYTPTDYEKFRDDVAAKIFEYTK